MPNKQLNQSTPYFIVLKLEAPDLSREIYQKTILVDMYIEITTKTQFLARRFYMHVGICSYIACIFVLPLKGRQ